MKMLKKIKALIENCKKSMKVNKQTISNQIPSSGHPNRRWRNEISAYAPIRHMFRRKP